jgi:ribosomal protein L27
MGRDHTIFAQIEGKVTFTFDKVNGHYVVSVTPTGAEAEAAEAPAAL